MGKNDKKVIDLFAPGKDMKISVPGIQDVKNAEDKKPKQNNPDTKKQSNAEADKRAAARKTYAEKNGVYNPDTGAHQVKVDTGKGGTAKNVAPPSGDGPVYKLDDNFRIGPVRGVRDVLKKDNSPTSDKKSTGLAFRPFEPWMPKGGLGALRRDDVDVSVPLVSEDGKRYGNVTRTAFEAIRSGNISSYVPVNMEEQISLSRFVTSPIINLGLESGKSFGKVSVAAYNAIMNDGLDEYTPYNDEEKESLRKYNAYLSGEADSNIKALRSESQKLSDIYEKAKGYKQKADWYITQSAIIGKTKAEEAEREYQEYLKGVGYSSLEDIAGALGAKNTELKQAEIAEKGKKLSAVADPLSQEYDLDFNKKSKYNPEKAPLITIGEGKRIYEYINAEDKDKAKYAYENEYAVYDEMTKDEVALYNYYYNLHGKEKASEYLATIEESLHRRAAQKKFDKVEGSRWEELLQVPYIGMNQAVTGLKNAFNTKDEYIPYNQGQILAGMISEDIPDGTAWQVAFDLGSTTFNMAPSIAAGIINPAAGAVMMGVSSAGNAYQDKLNSGEMDKSQARVYSSIIGFSEAGLSYFLGGISKLGGKVTGNALSKIALGIDNAAAKFALEYGGKLGSEALEESLQSVLEPMFENMVLGYMKNEDVDWGEVAYSGLLGALSAGLFEGHSVYRGTFGANAEARRVGADIRSNGTIADVMSLTENSPAESDAHRLSVLYKDRGISQDNISDLQIGRLHQLSKENVRDILSDKKSTAEEKTQALDTLSKLNKFSQTQKTSERKRDAFDEIVDMKPVADEVYYQIQNVPGTKKQYVKADRQVIKGDDPTVWAKDVKAYIDNNIRKGQDVSFVGADGDVLTITADTSGKARVRDDVTMSGGARRPMTDDEYSTKLRMETHIDELSQVSMRNKGNLRPDKKNHPFAKDGWHYRTAYFEDFDGQYYRLTLSVGQNGEVNTVYHVSNIKEAQSPRGSKASQNKSAVGASASANNISQGSQKSNNNFNMVRDHTASEGSEGETAGLTAGDIEVGNISDELKVRLENYKNVLSRLGFSVTYVPNREIADNVIGYADITNREVYLSPERIDDALMMHELTHVIDRGFNSGYIKSLVSFFKREFSEDWNKAIKKAEENYKNIPGANLEAEALADMCMRLAEDNYINMAESMDIKNLKQICLMFQYMVEKVKSVFSDDVTAHKLKMASLKWQLALRKAMKKGMSDNVRGVSGMYYNLIGWRKDGIEVYETSEETKRKPYKERRKAFLEIMSNEYRGRTARFIKDGKKYYATFEEDDLQKNIYGDKKSDDKGRDAKLNVGADGGMFDLVEHAKYVKSSDEDGKDIKSHKDIVDWDYYEKTVQIDDVVYDVYINVRNKTADSFVYSVHLRENTKIKVASPHRSAIHASVKSGDNHLYDVSVSQDGENSNKNLSSNDDVSFAVATDENSVDDESVVADESTAGDKSKKSNAGINALKYYQQDADELLEELDTLEYLLDSGELDADERLAALTKKHLIEKVLSGKSKYVEDRIKDVPERELTGKAKKVADAVKAYRETRDVREADKLPTKRSLKTSEKYRQGKISSINRELNQLIRERNAEGVTDSQREELDMRINELFAQLREIAQRHKVYEEAYKILEEIDTAARPNHSWLNEVVDEVKDSKGNVVDSIHLSEKLQDKDGIIKDGKYMFNDVERNFRHFFGKYYKKAYDAIIQPLWDSKKRYTEGVKDYADKLNDEVVKKLGIKKGSKMSAAVMWLGEGMRPLTKAELIDKFGKEKAKEILKSSDYESLSEAFIPYTYKDCVKEFGEDAAQNIEKATEIFRSYYDELIDEVNKTRAMLYPNNPDKLVAKRTDYFHHFQEMGQGFAGLRNIFSVNNDIDPLLVGTSEFTQPKSKWQGFMQRRLGYKTEYDAVEGFLRYLPAAMHSIHIDPNIVNIRSLAYDLASAKAEENGGVGNTNANRFIEYLQAYANDLAGKTTSYVDREFIRHFGRMPIAVLSWLNNRTKASAVLGNLYSVLSQFTNVKNMVGKIEHQSDAVRGAVQTVAGLNVAGLNPNSEARERYKESGFLKERYMDKVFSQFDSNWQKINPVKWAADILGFADEFGTRITWNAAYNEALRKGIDNPAQYADNFTRACVAGRGIGEEALVFKSQLAKMFLPFRTEVLNDLRVQQDILFGEEYEVFGDGKKVKTNAGKRIKNIMQLYVVSMIVNAFIAAIKSDEFDPIEEAEEGYEEKGVLGALISVMEDYADGIGDPVAFDPIYDIVTGIYQGISEGESVGGDIGMASARALQNLAGDAVSNNPFSTIVLAALGVGEDETSWAFNDSMYNPGGMGMPLASNMASVLHELYQKDWGAAGAAAVKPFLPLGTQSDRSFKGIYDWAKGYSTTESAYDRIAGQEGDLKYLIEKNPENFIKSLLFGPGAFSAESDTFFEGRQFSEEEQAEILAHKDYEGRKSEFDKILAWNDYEKFAEEKMELAGEEYYSDKDGTPLYELYNSEDDNARKAIPYKKFSEVLKLTFDDVEYVHNSSPGRAKAMGYEYGERMKEWFAELNENETFRGMSIAERGKFLSGIASLEEKRVKTKELHLMSRMPEKEYAEFVADYEEKVAEKIEELKGYELTKLEDEAKSALAFADAYSLDSTDAYVGWNAADTASQYLEYYDGEMSEEARAGVVKFAGEMAARDADNVDRELARLSGAVGSKINVSGNAYGVVSYTKNKVEYKIDVPDDEVYNLCKTVDSEVRAGLESLFATISYRSASAEAQKEMVADVKRKIRGKIKARYKAKYPSIRVDSILNGEKKVSNKVSDLFDEIIG